MTARVALGVSVIVLLTASQIVCVEQALCQFPIEIQLGRDAAPIGRSATVLPDLPFDVERGYGYVGGERRESGVFVSGAGAAPLVWREGLEKYVLRLPRGEYRVELDCVETAVAASGLRVFDVIAEGQPLFRNVDIFARAGDFCRLTLSDSVRVNDGWLDLDFRPTKPASTARVAVLRVRRATDEPAVLTPVSRVTADGGPSCNVLRWMAADGASAHGYNVFRAEAINGDFVKINEQPVFRPAFVDHEVEPGWPYHYKVGFAAAESRPSAAVSAIALARDAYDRWVYDLQIDPEDLVRLGEKRPQVYVPATLTHHGKTYALEVKYDTSRRGWRAKKSFQARMDLRRSQLFYGRRQFYLSAEAADPSGLRELVTAAALSKLRLTAPRLRVALLFVNERFHGVYLDRERLGTRFRRRTGLEARNGVLMRPSRRAQLYTDWQPYGERVGQIGSVAAWTDFVRELTSLGSGEFERFAKSRLFLDRYVDRVALAILRGTGLPPVAKRYFLEDPRTRQWEWLEQEYGEVWGVRNFPTVESAPIEPERALLRSTFVSGNESEVSASTLHARFWSQPTLRALLLARLTEITENLLSPTAFDTIVDEADAVVGHWWQLDRRVWWPDRPSSEPTPGAQQLKEWYRRFVPALQQVVDAELRQPLSPLRLNEIHVANTSGERWVELWNGASESRSLAGHYLTDDPTRPRKLTLEGGTVGPEKSHRVLLPADIFPEVARRLFLYRFAAEGSPDLLDVVYFDSENGGHSYGRDPENGGWRFLAAATPGAPNTTGVLVPPVYTCRYGVEKGRDERLTIWLVPYVMPQNGGVRPSAVDFAVSVAKQTAFSRHPLTWDSENFRFQTVVDMPTKPMPYYFVLRSPDGVERSYPLGRARLAIVPPPPLRITELLPQPRAASGQREFIEIYNPANHAIELGGMYLTDQRRRWTKWRIPESTVIAARGYRLFLADGKDTENHTSFRLSNSGEYVGLRGRLEEGNLLIDSIRYHALPAGHSWGLPPSLDGVAREWQTPTPGRANASPSPPAKRARTSR